MKKKIIIKKNSKAEKLKNTNCGCNIVIIFGTCG